MAEEQDDEIQALKAIYDADFAGMWKLECASLCSPLYLLQCSCHLEGSTYSLSLICQPDIRGREAPRHHNH